MACDRLIYVFNGGHCPAPFGNFDFIKINQKFKKYRKIKIKNKIDDESISPFPASSSRFVVKCRNFRSLMGFHF